MKRRTDECFLDTPEGGFNYVIERRPRRKTIAIQVREDGRVVVAAPPLVPVFYLKKLLRKKAGWVHLRLSKASDLRNQRAEKSYENGAEIMFLGETYRLHLKDSHDSSLDTEKGTLYLGLNANLKQENTDAATALEIWYKTQAQDVFEQRSSFFSTDMCLHPSLIGIKAYKTRWGSCHTDGRIYFNWRLVMAPMAVIDYVVVHELSHLLHPNHSPLFWKQVETRCPSYREHRTWLRKNGWQLDVFHAESR